MKTKTTRWRNAIWGLALPLSCASVVSAFMIHIPNPIPIERLLKTASRAVAENPSSASKHYELARLHYVAFSRGLKMMEPEQVITGIWREKQDVEWLRHLRASELAYDDIGLESGIVPKEKSAAFNRAFERRHARLEKEKWTPAASLPARALAEHAEKAFEELGIAAMLDLASVHYALSRACVAEEFLRWSRAVKLARVPSVFRDVDVARVRSMYLAAFRLGTTRSSESSQAAGDLHKISTYEAGTSFLRLLAELPVATLPDEALERARAEVAEGIEKVRDWPADEVITLVTPVVLALESGMTMERLVDSTARVDFDLRGFGTRDRWPWIRPEAGILVWDPEGTAAIASGRQLFGGYTFQIFRANGYDALAAHDDDGDGVLRGGELAGIRVWFDRDGDGRSASEEVVDLAALGIVGIVVRATGTEGIHPTNPAGVIFADGRTLPTWDWMVAPHRN